MSATLTYMRRSATQSAIRGFLATARVLPDPAIRTVAHTAGAIAASTAPLRNRLSHNLNAALGPDAVPEGTIRRYFHNFARLMEWQARVYHQGLAGTEGDTYARCGDTMVHLDDAARRGRGVILAAPHLFGHEIVAGCMGRQHRVVALVREASSPRKQRIKDRWYQALGMGTVLRHRTASAAWDLQACLRTLRDGAVLGITPDLLVDSDEGIAISAFGRRVYVKPGMAALAMYSGAPIVTVLSRPGSDGVREAVLTPPQWFERPARHSRDQHTVKARTQQIMQDWFDQFESFVRGRPCEWLFWLDKRWTQVFRSASTNGDGGQ